MNIKNFFNIKGREEEVFDKIEIMLRIVVRSVEYLHKSLEYLKMMDFLSLEKNVFEIEKLEKKADEIHREIVNSICEGVFFGGIREDILNLLEKIDNIADSAKDSAKILILRKFEKDFIDHLFRKSELFDYLSCCTTAVIKLIETVNGLRKKKKEIMPLINSIEEYEERADELKDSIMKYTFRRADKFNLLSILLIERFIYSSDEIADNAEDASDIILILIAKGYS